MMPGERTQISPFSPVANALPASSKMPTSQPGMGIPTLPGRFLPSGLADTIDADSVQPYPS